ncbi:MAG: SDR family oxidoreductase [Lachnospiraceae bacterium]|nr:SDR family oxidoreductase [Lachnospiraceae bacterium]MBR7075596.1 SDR family oxidoreductase [Lachnospiraceae bacterium]
MKILVTGASGGIGRAICKKFLANGHEVIGMDLAPAAISQESYTHIIHDIRQEPYPKIEDVQVLINCAGIQSQSAEDIAVNLTAVIGVTEHYAFQEKIHAVVHIASASGLTGSEFPHYAASKGGLTAYTKNIAIRLAKYGATANSLCPGGVITDMNRHILDDEKLYQAVLDETLLHRWADTEEIADWVYFLACVNRSMTGENLLIDNGEAVKANFIW